VDCDDEVNKLSDENDLLTAALAASTSAGTRARWRLAAKAAVLSKRCEERKAEARRLRVKARKLESQLLKVEEHITSAAADFDRLRGRLSESNRETERARGRAGRARAARGGAGGDLGGAGAKSETVRARRERLPSGGAQRRKRRGGIGDAVGDSRRAPRGGAR
jgi:chromosome segregation ATPase